MKKASLILMVIISFMEMKAQSEEIKYLNYRKTEKISVDFPEGVIYKLNPGANRFISIFIQSKKEIEPGLFDQANQGTAPFVKAQWTDGLWYVEYSTLTNTDLFLKIKTRDSTESNLCTIDYLINIPASEKMQKDSVQVDKRKFSDYYFNIKLSDQRIISIGPTQEMSAEGRLVYLDSESGRFNVLYPLTDSTFYATYTMIDAYSDDILLTIHKIGNRPIAVDWTEGDLCYRNAPMIGPSLVEPIEFSNKDTKLRGILITPEDQGPFPLIVFAHGSGASTRDQGFFLSYFQRYGFAVLSFDKGGAGESSGDWITSSFDDLADDMIAGILKVKEIKNIDPERIGIFGISQAGWVGSICAAKSSDVKFLIMNTGSGVSVNKNMLYEYESIIRKSGQLPENEITRIKENYDKLLGLASDGEPFDTIQKFIESPDHKPWLQNIPMANLPRNARWWTWQKLNGHYDPTVALSNVNCPIFWVLAELDKNVPYEESLAGLQMAKKLSGNKDFTIVGIPSATHVVMETTTGYFLDDLLIERKFAKGYWNLMDRWKRNNILNTTNNL